MFGSEILDVAIGLFFVFAVLSLVCSALREMLEAWFKTRAVFLEDGIRELLGEATKQGTPWSRIMPRLQAIRQRGERWAKGKSAADGAPRATLTDALYEHPMVAGLYRSSYTRATERVPGWWLGSPDLPAYIPSGNFATALLDMAARGLDTASPASATRHSAAISIQNVRANVEQLANPRVQRAVLTAIDMSGGDIAKAQQNLEAWYDGAMDRVSGWYKRRTQYVLVLIGFMAAVVLNVNAITIVRYLYHDEAARSALVASAARGASDSTLRQAGLDTLLARLDQLDLPIGWRYGLAGVRPGPTPRAAGAGVGADSSAGMPGVVPRTLTDTTSTRERRPPAGLLVAALLGWLITALAVSFGAPFWFDLLNKIMVIRSTVKPHEKSREEASEDRQARRGAGASAAGASHGHGATAGAGAPPPPVIPVTPPNANQLRGMLPRRPALRAPAAATTPAATGGP